MPVGSPQTITLIRRAGPLTEPPFGNRHISFATSDNKVVIMTDDDPNVPGGFVITLDGTNADYPSVIGLSRVDTGSPETGTVLLTRFEEETNKVIQLSDTLYARLMFLDTVGSPLFPDLIIELVSVDLSTGAARVKDTYNLSPNFLSKTAQQASAYKLLYKISDTRFGAIWNDDGGSPRINTNALISTEIFQITGSPVTIAQTMAPTILCDLATPTYNRGDVNADASEVTCAYLPTNRILCVAIGQNVSGTRDMVMVTTKFNVSYTGVDTFGPFGSPVFADSTTYGTWDTPQLYAIDDTHVYWNDEWRNDPNTGFPMIHALIEIDPTTLAITPGEIFLMNYSTGSPTPFEINGIIGSPTLGSPAGQGDEWDLDTDRHTVVNGNKIYTVGGGERRFKQINTGTQTINVVPFDGTPDINTGDRAVTTASRLTTDWPGQTNGTRVVAADTGILYEFQSAGSPVWQPATTNSSSWRDNGLWVFEHTINTVANTLNLTKFEAITSEQYPRYEAGSPTGTMRPTYISCSFESDSNDIVKLPNGRYVITCELSFRLDQNAPFYTSAATAANLDVGGDFLGLYFDPANMP